MVDEGAYMLCRSRRVSSLRHVNIVARREVSAYDTPTSLSLEAISCFLPGTSCAKYHSTSIRIQIEIQESGPV